MMRLMLAACVVMVCTAVLCPAQDKRTTRPAPTTPAPRVNSYLVEITEFKLVDQPDPKRSAVDILNAFEGQNADQVKQIETVRISALEGQESMAQFGKRVAVTIGTTTTQFGKARNAQERSIGTIVKLTPQAHNDQVYLKLSYEAARLSDNGSEDTPPDTITTQYAATVLLEPGTPKLLCGTSAEGGSYLRVQVSEQ